MNEDEIKILGEQLQFPNGTKGIEVAQMMQVANKNMILTSINSLNLNDKTEVLEIGHGNGAHLEEFYKQFSDIHYTGLEISELMHQEAFEFCRKNLSNKKINLKMYDGLILPFSNKIFDSVFTVNTLYFWRNPETFLNDIYRVLKPSGKLSVCFGLKNYMESLPFTKYGFKLYNEIDFLQLVKTSSFDVIDSFETKESIDSINGSPMERIYQCVVLKKKSN